MAKIIYPKWVREDTALEAAYREGYFSGFNAQIGTISECIKVMRNLLEAYGFNEYITMSPNDPQYWVDAWNLAYLQEWERKEKEQNGLKTTNNDAVNNFGKTAICEDLLP